MSSYGLTATWGASPNASSQTYTLDASTASNFTGTLTSSTTLNRNATLSTLTNGTVYYLRVRPAGYAIATVTPNNWALLSSTTTLPGSTPINPLITNVYASSMTVAWGAAVSGTGYTLDASTASDFSGTVISSVTNSISITTLTFNTGQLMTNTTYFVRVGGLFGGATGYVNTLPSNIRFNVGQSCNGRRFSTRSMATSVTVAWVPLPATPSSSTSEGYRARCVDGLPISREPSSLVSRLPWHSALTVQNLQYYATYYVRVGALNWISAPDYVNAGPFTTQNICPATWPNGYCSCKAGDHD